MIMGIAGTLLVLKSHDRFRIKLCYFLCTAEQRPWDKDKEVSTMVEAHLGRSPLPPYQHPLCVQTATIFIYNIWNVTKSKVCAFFQIGSMAWFI